VDQLETFVKDGLARRIPRADMEAALAGAGWTAGDVRAALDHFAEMEFPIPVPRPRPYLSARDAFLYLVLFSTLYVVAVNFGSLLFSFIDHWIPDPSVDRDGWTLSQAIRWPVSALIASTPVFASVAWLTGREVARDPIKRTSKVRRWLTYVTLFVAAAVIVGDVTSLVYSLLGGEVTTRFLLKSLVVAGIAATAFVYYLTDVRTDERDGAS
jgi:hypothetical protein